MTAEPTPSMSGTSQGGSPAWAAVVALAATIGGAVAIAAPFVQRGEEWTWNPRTQADLADATVNAELLSVDARGVTLSPQGERAISVITSPLSLPSNTARMVVIELAADATVESTDDRTVVRLLWQTEPAEAFRYAEQEAAISTEPARVVFSLPESPERLHRLGVQIADWRRPIVVGGIELTNLSTAQRIATFARQAVEREPLRNHSINFIRGPVMLGHGLNYYLCALIAVACGGYVLRSIATRRRIDWRVPIGIALAAWLIGDVQATANLVRNVREEMRGFSDLPRREQIALSEGPDIAWAYEQLLKHCPEGGTYAVVSDDPFTPAHRIDYLLAPQRTRAELTSDEPELIVVIGSSELRFDPTRGVFQWKDGPPTPATLVAQRSEAVYLLKRGHKP